MSGQAVAVGHDPEEADKMELLQAAYEGNMNKVFFLINAQW